MQYYREHDVYKSYSATLGSKAVIKTRHKILSSETKLHFAVSELSAEKKALKCLHSFPNVPLS